MTLPDTRGWERRSITVVADEGRVQELTDEWQGEPGWVVLGVELLAEHAGLPVHRFSVAVPPPGGQPYPP